MARLIVLSFLVAALLACFGPVAAEMQAGSEDMILEVDATRTQDHLQITPPPQPPIDLELEKRAVNSKLIGYYSWRDSWHTSTCPSGEFYATTASNLGACCTQGEEICTYATGCNDGSTVLFQGGYTGTCNTHSMCDTLTVFNSKGVGSTGIQSVIQCFSTESFNERPRSYYRQTWPLTTSQATTTVPEPAQTKTQTITAKPSPDSATREGPGTLWSSVISLAITFLGVILP